LEKIGVLYEYYCTQSNKLMYLFYVKFGLVVDVLRLVFGKLIFRHLSIVHTHRSAANEI